VVKLDCINQLTGDPSGFGYVAHFSYQNPNATAIYVPKGTDNSLTALGTYSGVQPEVFLPAGGKFDVYFDGLKLTWTVKTYEGSTKTAVSADASSASTKCATGARVISSASSQAIISTEDVALQGETLLPKAGVYPNPVTDRLSIWLSNNTAVTDRDIIIYDLAGRVVKIKKVSHSTTNVFVLDMSNLISGVYLVKIKTGKGYVTAKIIKQ
jgi:hypothetical protein